MQTLPRALRRGAPSAGALESFLTPPGSSYLGLSSHFHPGLQELIEVLTKLARSLGQVLRGPTRRLHQLIGRLVQASRSLVELALGLLEVLGAGRKLRAETGVKLRGLGAALNS